MSVFKRNVFVCVVDEGYQRRVTVDEEDSTILVFDNWKQVGQALSQMHKSTLRFACFWILYFVFNQWLSEFVAVLSRWECIIKKNIKQRVKLAQFSQNSTLHFNLLLFSYSNKLKITIFSLLIYINIMFSNTDYVIIIYAY